MGVEIQAAGTAGPWQSPSCPQLPYKPRQFMEEPVMDNVTRTSNEKISDALKLLDEAARERKDEVKNLLLGKFEHLKDAVVTEEARLKDALTAAGKRAAETARHLKDVSEEKAKEIATAVDESVHKNPWPYIGGAALGALVLGYFMGRRK